MPWSFGGSTENFQQYWATAARDAHEIANVQAAGLLFSGLAKLPESGYYFLHIPKTAGTSTSRFLERLSIKQLEPRVWLWDQLIQAERKGIEVAGELLTGHFHLHLEPFLKRKLIRIAMLRDPIARTISHYLHVRRHPQHPFFSLANTMSLYEFCTHSETRHMVENYQARYLVDFGLDLRGIAQFFSSEDLLRYRLQIFLEQLTVNMIPEDLLLRASEQNLKTFAAVGITERFAESMKRFANALEVDFQVFDEHHNVATSDRITESGLDSRTRLAIMEATQVDLLLYRSIAATFEA